MVIVYIILGWIGISFVGAIAYGIFQYGKGRKKSAEEKAAVDASALSFAAYRERTAYATAEEERINRAYGWWTGKYNQIIELETKIQQLKKDSVSAKRRLRFSKAKTLMQQARSLGQQLPQAEAELKEAAYSFSSTSVLNSAWDICDIFDKIKRGSQDIFFSSFFVNSNHFICATGDNYLIFMPCYVALLKVDSGTIDVIGYNRVEATETAREERTDHVWDDDEIASVHWLYERVDGGPDRRYNNNQRIVHVWRGIVEISACEHHATLMFPNRKKAIAYRENVDKLVALFRGKYAMVLHDALNVKGLHKDGIAVERSDEEKRLMQENGMLAQMRQRCCTAAKFEVSYYSEYFRTVSLEYTGTARSIIIPEKYPYNGKEVSIASVHLSWENKEVLDDLLVCADGIELGADILCASRNVCFAPGVNSCKVGKLWATKRLCALESINFPKESSALVEYLLSEPSFYDSPYFKSLPVDEKGVKFLNGKAAGADRSLEVYDVGDETVISLLWVNAQRRVGNVVVGKNATDILFPAKNSETCKNYIGGFTIRESKTFVLENGVLYKVRGKTRKLLFIPHDFSGEEFVVDESVASVEDAFPSSVRRLVLRSHAKLHCAIDLATIREIVVSDENMVLKYSDFKNIAPHTVIYAHKTSIQKIARYKAFDFRPLEEDKGERLRLEEQRVRDFIASFTVKKGKIIRWTGEQSNIEIPEKLASAIGKEAFAENQTLKSVKLPDGIAEIGEGAFKNCTSLRKVVIPESVKKIGDNAFEGCISLDFMESLAGVDSIGTRAFYRCSSLGAVMLAPACTIGPEAFATCKNLNDVRGFEGTTWERLSPFRNTPWLSGRAGDGTFIEGGKLLAYVGEQREYTIPQGVVEIAASAFENNALIEKVTIRDGTKIIGARAFAFCENLKSVTIPDSVTQIDDTAFFGSPEVVFRCYRGSVASTFRLHNKIKVDYISRVQQPVAERVQRARKSDFDLLTDEERRMVFAMRREREQKVEGEEREAMREKTTRMLEGLSKSPLVDCDEKRLLTNSIVRRYFQQVDAAQEAEYTLYFIDEEGNRISKSVVFAAGGNDGKAYATFELSSKNGFDKEKRYYLIVADGQGTPLAKLDYCIDISFANDFGF